MANPRYSIINASNDVFSRPSSKGDAMVQPSTRRVVELDEAISDRQIEVLASSGIFVKKTNEAAQNDQPLPAFDENIANARNRLMLAAGQEREDIISALWADKAVAGTATAAAEKTAAPSTTPVASGATATASTTGR